MNEWLDDHWRVLIGFGTLGWFLADNGLTLRTPGFWVLVLCAIWIYFAAKAEARKGK